MASEPLTPRQKAAMRRDVAWWRQEGCSNGLMRVEEVASLLDENEALTARIEQMESALDESQLRSIEARNPGIDMNEVRRIRSEVRSTLDSEGSDTP